MQDCQDDVVTVPQQAGEDLTMSSCEETCPDLYLATARFVFALKVFTIVLIMPLVCLPFVYLWIIRRVNSEELLARFGGEEEDGSGGILAKEIMENLREVVLIPLKPEGSHKWKRSGNPESSKGDGNVKMVRIAHKYNSPDQDEDVEKGPKENEGRIRQWLRKKGEEEQELLSSRTSGICEWESVKECCICMCEFDTVSELPSATKSDNNDSTIQSGDGTSHSEELDAIVQTKCGHLFHKKCIGGWVGGDFGSDDQSSASRRNGRALRRTCPLCREDLAPETESTNESTRSATIA